MIGVATGPAEREIVEEFFELFKTPWEPAVPGRHYAAVLSTDGRVDHLDADVFLVYSSESLAIDRRIGALVAKAAGPVDADWQGWTLPIYGHLAIFGGGTDREGLHYRGERLEFKQRSEDRVVHRLGYDLFREVRFLLTEGQPAARAAVPTLEVHIERLRCALIEAGVSFVEIPPRPHEYDFICCLTHDVDFFGIRRHTFDRTLAGFVARASLGSLVDVVRGRRPLAEAIRNWVALLSLPLVYLRLARDFWRPFEQYAKVDGGRPSTFFLVPFKGRPGVAPDGGVDPARAVPYQASEIREHALAALERGSELAVHGIDAWKDAEAGRSEAGQLKSITGNSTTGVRMHWLYFAANSPRQLDAAGFDYDSTWGYNDAVGYRAGTGQAFRFPGTGTLLELPLAIMDSALFYPSRMNLDRDEAFDVCREIVKNTQRLGGTLVINWHERSLAPERLWGAPYQALLEHVERGNRVWFSTAGDAIGWFRWRRSIRFAQAGASASVQVSVPHSIGTAGIVRVHQPGATGAVTRDLVFDGMTAVDVELPAGEASTTGVFLS